jgi:hypothetical protein
LSLPVLCDAVFSQDVGELTREIAGSNPNAELHALARRVAEAQIDLCRVRHARYAFLSSAVRDLDHESPPKLRTKALLDRQLARVGGLAAKPEGPQKFATILSDMTQQLAAMDRYERRALSRRKFAIRAFDAARRQAVSERT